MDCQLEICWRGHILEQGILGILARGAYQYTRAVCDNEMVATCGETNYGAGWKRVEVGGTTGKDAACNFYPNLAKLHPDNHPHG